VEKVAERTDVRRPAHRTLRSELAHAYSAAYGKTCRHDTLTALEGIVAWLRRCERQDGVTVLRSVPQAVRGIEGWQPTGSTKRDHSRFRNSLARRLDMLIELGVVEGWEAVYRANGEGRGILVALRRDSSVGGAHLVASNSARRRGCSSSTPRVSPPLREKSPCTPSKGVDHAEKPSGRARRARGGDHAATVRAVRALAEAGEGAGVEILAAAPWLADLPPAVLTRAAVLHFAPQPSAGWAKHWRLSLSRASRLSVEASVSQLDRYDGRGAGAAAILDLAAGGWRLHVPTGRPPRFVEPRTPGLLAKGLRQRARMARRAARMRDELYAAESSPGGSTLELMTSASSCGATCAA
jgi:hypothetical protein